MTFKIHNTEVGPNNSPFIIAEVSANHNGSIDTALKTIKAAKEAGASAVKIQTYTPDTMTIDCNQPDFLIEGGLWDGYNLYQLYKEAHTPFEWHERLFAYAAEIGITLFSTPFDASAVSLLESLNCPAYKVASFEITDIPLLKAIARTKKPIIISTGLANPEEIAEAVQVVTNEGNVQLVLLHCISAYPTPVELMNLKAIQSLKAKFNVQVGLSDHSMGIAAANTAIALGATVIEKHFILSRDLGGPDSSFSIEPSELKLLVDTCQQTQNSLGSGEISTSQIESNNKKFRRSIYAVRDISAGDIITANDIKVIRPGFGLAPKHLEKVIGNKSKQTILRGTPLSWSLLENTYE